MKKGYKAGNKTFKVYLDGFNLMPHLKGEVKENPRPGFLYWGDEGDLMALRYGNWKVHFAVQRAEGVLAWQEPFAELRFPCSLTCGPIRSRTQSLQPTCTTISGGQIACLRWHRPGQSSRVHEDHDGVPAAPSPESWSPGKVMEKLRRHQEALESGSGAGVK